MSLSITGNFVCEAAALAVRFTFLASFSKINTETSCQNVPLRSQDLGRGNLVPDVA